MKEHVGKESIHSIMTTNAESFSCHEIKASSLFLEEISNNKILLLFLQFESLFEAHARFCFIFLNHRIHLFS